MAILQEILADFLKLSPVIPVVTVDDPDHAPEVAKALLAGGVGIMELALRTPDACDAIAKVSDLVPEMIVGAGTVVSSSDAERAVDHGAKFIVSPGSTSGLLEKARFFGVPLLPGVATPSEVMILLELGYRHLKLFPAEAVGNIRFLKAINAPFPFVQFCPTGGISRDNAGLYLKLANVISVGGSWLAPRHVIAANDWNYITTQAKFAAMLSQQPPNSNKL